MKRRNYTRYSLRNRLYPNGTRSVQRNFCAKKRIEIQQFRITFKASLAIFENQGTCTHAHSSRRFFYRIILSYCRWCMIKNISIGVCKLCGTRVFVLPAKLKACLWAWQLIGKSVDAEVMSQRRVPLTHVSLRSMDNTIAFALRTPKFRAVGCKVSTICMYFVSIM